VCVGRERGWGEERGFLPPFSSSCVEELSLRLARGEGLKVFTNYGHRCCCVFVVVFSFVFFARSLVRSFVPFPPGCCSPRSALANPVFACASSSVFLAVCFFFIICLFSFCFLVSVLLLFCLLSFFFLCRSSLSKLLLLLLLLLPSFRFCPSPFPLFSPRFSAFLLWFCDFMRFFCFCFCFVLFLRSSLMKLLLLFMMFLFPSRCLVSSSAAVGVLSAAPGMVG
jgi:hypothetical protein